MEGQKEPEQEGSQISFTPNSELNQANNSIQIRGSIKKQRKKERNKNPHSMKKPTTGRQRQSSKN